MLWGMTTREAIVSRVEAFLAQHRMSERRFGLLVCNDHKLVDRLRRDSVTLARIEAAERFMDGYQPSAAPPRAPQPKAA
jgi:hypothetical protein